MWEHTDKYHGGAIGGISDYKINVTGTHRRPLDRIMDEAVRRRKLWSDTHSGESKISLSGKTEYFKPEYYATTYRKWRSSED